MHYFVIYTVAASMATAMPIVVESQYLGETLHLHASVVVHASPAEVWDVIIDYEGQPSFLPNLAESKVISHNGSGSLVKQKGWMEFLFMHFDFDVEYLTREAPPFLLSSSITKGNVKRMDSVYRLSPCENNGTCLEYNGKVEFENWLPPVIGPLILRRKLETQIDALIHEVGRRQRVRVRE